MKMMLQNVGNLKFRGVLLLMGLFCFLQLPLSAQIAVQAENYANMLGVQTEGCSDNGGGVNVGWIDNNDWLEYNLTVPMAGDYVLSLRVASLNGGGVVSIESGSTSLTTINVAATGGWQVWNTVAGSAITLAQGVQTIKLKATNGGFNLNWFELRLTNPVDTDLPTTPAIINSSADYNSISMSWTQSTDATSTVSGYKIFNNDAFAAYTTETTYSLSKLPSAKEFNLSVYACDLAGNTSSAAQLTLTTTAREMTLVWFDEFDGTEVDRTKWNFETGGHGWGNGEAQYYTDGANSTVANGFLTIEARKETVGSNLYTSSRMNNANKGDFLYGRIEVRAKLPSTGGTWPAIWTLPTEWVYGGWPECGEIDIMEHTGNNLGYVFGTIHTGAYNHVDGTAKSGGITLTDAATDFHTYILEWYPDHLDWYYDDQLIFSYENEYKTFAEWPFDIEHHLMLNVAVGGGLGGTINSAGVWPQQMVVDYVRIYDLDFGQDDTEAPTTPTNLQSVVSGIDVQLDWTASSDNKYVEKYNIYKNDTWVAAVAGTSTTITGLDPLTEYSFSIEAVDFGGNVSGKVSVAATTTDIPKISIPGKFEAENYLYMLGVEKETCTDIGGGQNLAYLNPDDWVEYNIDVATAGSYVLSTRAASQAVNGSFQLLDKDNNLLTTVETQSTGGWQTWNTNVSQSFYLSAGVQRIKIKFLVKDFNINWFEIAAVATSINSTPGDRNTIYPNPLNGSRLTVALEEGSSEVEVLIYAVDGKKVYAQYFQNAQNSIVIDDLDLKAGLYLLSVKKGDNVLYYKLISE